jgi:hypothetical protein
MSAEDIELEPVWGLPAELPPGEEIVWQGQPDWKAMARHTFKLRWLLGYFAAFVAVRAGFAIQGGEGLSGLFEMGVMVLVFAACIGLVSFMAWLNARATAYTITTRRIVMRIGVALPTTWNLPFRRLASADLVERGDGEGDIVLHLTQPSRVGWLYFWPHVQPGHVFRARPAFRAVREPARVARALGAAVEQWAARQDDLQVSTESPLETSGADAQSTHEGHVPAHLGPSLTADTGH